MIEDIDIRTLKELNKFIAEHSEYDFSEYAQASLKRRFLRIMTIQQMNHPEDIIRKMKDDPSFADYLAREITVNTTEFFRDPSFWRYFRDHILPSFAGNQTIRIWHAACSSGEEVYSMAILLREAGLEGKCQITATDLNEDVLKTARVGQYPERNLALLKSNYIRFNPGGNADAYIVSTDSDYFQIDSSLISGIIFRKHNLAVQHAFSKFDIILCRNALIYFNFELQDRVVSVFSDSLFSGGYLAVGSKETIAWCKSSGHFETLSAEEKVYRKNF